MNNIIETLYREYASSIAKQNQKRNYLTKAEELANINYEKLMTILNDEQKACFKTFLLAVDELDDIVRQETFTYAIKFGISLMSETFAPNEINTY